MGGELSVIDMFSNLMELRDGGAVVERQRGVSGDWGLWTVAAFHADSNDAVHSHVWERHPLGDELLYLLSGAITVHMRDHADGEGAPRALSPGTCCVVPAGQWHRLTVEEPGDLVAITPRAETAHEAVSK
ncbi:cupin domain-containing protein [Mycobacterium fragae]|nr:cupin domain-containing protein [Mycobacterium fragae]